MDRTSGFSVSLAIVVLVGLSLVTTQVHAQGEALLHGHGRGGPMSRGDAHQVGSMSRFIPGVLGAVAGSYFGGGFGVVGKIVGGTAGWFIGNQLGKMLLGGGRYDCYDHYPSYCRQAEDSSYPAYQTGYGSSYVPTFTPLAPLDTKLSDLRDAYFKALAAYQQALKNGTDSAKIEAKKRFDTAYRDYKDAKRSALGQ